MNKTLFKHISVGVKPTTIDKIIDALCSSDAITRYEIVEKSGIGLTTVCKVADSLIDSGTVFEKVRAQADSSKRKPCGHLSVTRRLCTAVIDLSSPNYSVDLICGGERYFHYTHRYDSGVYFEDNLYALLSRAFSTMRIKKDYALQICVIYSDVSAPSETPQVVLPSICDKDTINRAIYGICKRMPQLYVSKPQAVSAAIKYNVISKADGFGGVSYLHIGTVLSGFSVLSDGKVVSCRLGDMIIKDGLTAGSYAQNAVTRDDFQFLLEKSVNFLDSAFGAQTLIIESNSFEFDSASVKTLQRSFASLRLPTPIVYPIHEGQDNPSILTLAAARQAEAIFIRSYLK